jgi:DNA-binding response OmpR family regulator
MKILMTARDRGRVAPLAEGLEARHCSLVWAGSGSEALSMAREEAPDLAVIAEDIGDMTAFNLVARLMAVNAMTYTAVLSDLGSEEFHAAGEGLGILVQLPSAACAEDAGTLIDRLTTVRGS